MTIHERETEAGEKEALSLIRELVHVQEFDFADTRPGSEHHLTPDPALLEEDEICRYTIQGSQSVLTGITLRCRRALGARDAIGIQFYLHQSNRTQDFDYLTLLLTGALDAELRIAKRAFDLDVNDRAVGFMQSRFKTKLSTAAPRLHTVITSELARALGDLLFAPRNTIHAARLRSAGYQVAGFPALAVVKLGDLGRAAWEASRVLGGPERWGLFLMPDFPFEPFSYATPLIDETFQILVEVSAAIASEGASAHFTDEPPAINENLPYAEETPRIALLT